MAEIYAGTSDGRIESHYISQNPTWALSRDAATGTAVTTNETSDYNLVAVTRFGARGGSNTYKVERSFLYFDVSGVNGTVEDVTLNIHGGVTADGSASDGTIWGVKGGPPVLTGLEVEQFDDIPGYQTGTQMFGNVTQYTSIGIIGGGSWDPSDYNIMQGTSSLMTDMDSLNVVTIVLTDYFYDARNNAPTSNGSWNVSGYYADNTGTSKDPFLRYTMAGYGHEVNTVVAASIGKVNTVETANIGKIITVD